MRTTTRQGGISCRAEFDEKVNEVAALEVELRQLTAEMDEELQAVRDRYAARIQEKESLRKALRDACGLYAAMHQEVLRPGLRSGETALARFGFNLGNPTLVLLNRKHTWKTVMEAIKARGQAFAETYLSFNPKPNKELMKAQLSDAELAALGCRVEQTDSFFVEAKDDNAPQD